MNTKTSLKYTAIVLVGIAAITIFTKVMDSKDSSLRLQHEVDIALTKWGIELPVGTSYEDAMFTINEMKRDNGCADFTKIYEC